MDVHWYKGGWLLLLVSFACSVQGQERGAIRLWRNGSTSLSYTSGRVQLVTDYRRQWGNICDDSSFGMTEATVICHQLGYTGASSYSRTRDDMFGTDTSPTVLSSVDCSTSSYLVILQCNSDSSPRSSCTDSNDVSVFCNTIRIWDNPYDGQVRLTGGTTVNQGLVEVYCNGQWGTICRSSEFNGETGAICRQLGYSYSSNFNLGMNDNSSQPIWLRDVRCANDFRDCIASCISTCPTEGNTSDSCEDTSITCRFSRNNGAKENTCSELLSVVNGPIRLWRSGSTSLSYTSGRVQLVINEQWGNICDDASFGITEATVICHQLGYTGASSYSRTSGDTFGTDTSPAVLSSVDCSTSSYLVILQCSYDSTPPSSCTDSNDVSVTCYENRIWENPYDGQIRLTGGTTVNEGLVEVYCSRQWGTVCSIGQGVADTICKQLGYHNALRHNHLPIRGNSRQSILLDNVSCGYMTSQSCISHCQICPSLTSCDHSEDITVQCRSETGSTGGANTQTCVNSNDIPNGPIRLWRNGMTSPSYDSGRVQLFFDRQWGNICDETSFNAEDEAEIICHHLGYTGAHGYSRARDDGFGMDRSPSLFTVDCHSTSPSQLTTYQCSIDPAPPSCTDSDDVSVYCYSSRIWDNPFSGQIRLTGGATVNQGLVEVYCNGQWGTVCSDDEFRQEEADTVCRQLGYSNAYQYNHLRISTHKSILLDDVRCSSSDECIASCSSRCSSTVTCVDQSQYVTIECYGRQYRGASVRDCRYIIDERPSSGSNAAAIWIGSVVGGTFGSVFLFTCVIVSCIVACIWCDKDVPNRPTSNSTVRASTATTHSRVTPLNVPSVQPSVLLYNHLYNSHSTQEPVNNEPSDPTVTEAPPPAYELCDNFTTCTETSDVPPDYPDPPSFDVSDLESST